MKMPVIALRGLTAMPSCPLHFDVSRDRSKAAVEAAMAGDRTLFAVSQRSVDTEVPDREDLFPVGCVLKVRQMLRMPGGELRVLAEGAQRAELADLTEEGGCLRAEVVLLPRVSIFRQADQNTRTAMRRILTDLLEDYAAENPLVNEKAASQLREEEDISTLMDMLAGLLPFEWQQRQNLLEAGSDTELFNRLRRLLESETQICRIRNELQEKTREEIDQNQKDYVLREQMKVIRRELGEEDLPREEEEFEEKIRALDVSEEIREKLMKELRLLRNLGSGNQEGYVHRMYLETALEIPWGKYTEEETDIRRAREILDRDHSGLTDVKDRILEHLAVRSLTGGKDTGILCLVGPPGTGKTSVARSIAEAMGRSYVRVCLGGVRDEAEIRGHRKTYLGSMPGRIAEGLRQAGSMDPLMLLDEIDKLGSDYKGDPSSALLEVLDSEQNARFRDHYLEVPLDLSRVFFIATANTTETVPRPLLDRMEVIELTGYSANEKFHIAREHLIPKQIRLAGLTEEKFSLSDGAVRALIASYTREAGVRSLERRIGELCRKTARRILEGEETGEITEDDLPALLGPEKYRPLPAAREDAVGIARGLAWTQVGGDTLEIEVNVTEGTGKLLLTGKLGDVMKESAQIAVSYVRSLSGEEGFPADYTEHHDIHLHVPEGAVPKDGPSAGITMAAAVLSAVTGKKVRSDLAMTGEVTLRGRVLPVGGLKEKLLAAGAAGIREVLVPEENRPEILELSPEITDPLRITYVGSMADVRACAFR